MTSGAAGAPGLQIIRYAAPGIGVGVALWEGAGARDLAAVRLLPSESLGGLLQRPLAELRGVVEAAARLDPVRVEGLRLLPPLDGLTEVWAAGVTYQRSSQARQEESQLADVYARVYNAARPELFFKAPAWRVCGDGEPIGIRADSAIDVPEPELALVCNALGEVVGLTICNDVSSRSIEGENPLYLPQAKIYAGSCALGPGIAPVWAAGDPTALGVTVAVRRGGGIAWSGQTSTALLRRRLDDLVEHLFRQLSFPQGVVLSTGTGLVPDLAFTLQPGDEVAISIDGLGTLTNPVRRVTPDAFAWLTPAPDRVPDQQPPDG